MYRGVARIWEGGGQEFFVRLENLFGVLLWGLGACPQENFLNAAIWWVLVCVFIRFCV